MTRIMASETGVTDIGYLGESGHRVIAFHDSIDLLKKYPQATVTILHQRKGDDIAYAVDSQYVSTANGIVEWTIQSGDVAVAGQGQCELVFIQDGVIAKTLIYTTLSRPSLDGAGEAPDPVQDWMTGITDQIAQLQQQVTLLTEQVSLGMEIPRFESGELIRIEGIITNPEIAYGLNITTGTGEGYWPKAGDLFVLKTTADIFSVQDGQYYLCFDVPRYIEDEEGFEIESWDDSYIIRNIKASGNTSGVKLFEKDKIYLFRCYTSSMSGGSAEVLNYIDPQNT